MVPRWCGKSWGDASMILCCVLWSQMWLDCQSMGVVRWTVRQPLRAGDGTPFRVTAAALRSPGLLLDTGALGRTELWPGSCTTNDFWLTMKIQWKYRPKFWWRYLSFCCISVHGQQITEHFFNTTTLITYTTLWNFQMHFCFEWLFPSNLNCEVNVMSDMGLLRTDSKGVDTCVKAAGFKGLIPLWCPTCNPNLVKTSSVIIMISLGNLSTLPSSLKYKTPQIPTLKRFSYCLAAVFTESLEAGCQVANEDVVGAAPTGGAPTTSEWSTILLPTKVWLILEVLRYWWCSCASKLSSVQLVRQGLVMLGFNAFTFECLKNTINKHLSVSQINSFSPLKQCNELLQYSAFHTEFIFLISKYNLSVSSIYFQSLKSVCLLLAFIFKWIFLEKRLHKLIQVSLFLLGTFITQSR